MSGPAGSYRPPDSADEATRLRAQAARLWSRELAALRGLGLVDGMRILDLGCGVGGSLAPLARDVRPRSLTGVDLSPARAAQARTVCPVAVADGAHLPFFDDVFDFVLMRFVLRHAPARARVLAEAARVVRPGGVVCAVDVDERATTFEPEPASWPPLAAALAETAERHGGDPFVGRRLPGLLAAGGLREVRAQIVPVTTSDLPAADFIEVMLAPAARPIDPSSMSPDRAAAAWGDLRAWAARPGVFAYTLGIAAAGIKAAP